MKKVLFLANGGNGFFRFRYELAERFSQEGYKMYASLPDDLYEKELREIGCESIYTPVDRRGINPVTDFKLLLAYLKILKKVKPDIVITYTIKPNIYGGIACRLKKIPMYANITGLGTAFQKDSLLSKIVTLLYKFALKKTKKVFFENIENRDILVGKKIIPAERTVCLNGAGVNLDKFVFSEYPAKTSETKFLFIGRIMQEKGIDELFYAAERLKEEGYNISVDILGGYEENYKDRIEDLEKRGIIKYHGFQNDVKPFIKETHCFVLPSYHEGMANTLLECGAMGRPLITSNIHGCLEAVKDGETGYLCEVKNGESLYDKMKQFVELAYEKKVEMGEKSYKYVSDKFDKRKVVDKTVKEIFV